MLAGRQVEAAHEGDRNASEFAHDELGGARHLVGQRENGRLELAAGGVALAEVALERRDAAHADRDVRQALAPRPAERVGDDDGHVSARALPQALAQRPRGAVRILGQQRDRIAVHVRLIDARVGADPAVVRLGDEDAAVHPHDATRLPQDDLDQARIAVEMPRHRERRWRRRHVGEPDEPAFGLRDDLLADHDHVAGDERCALPRGGIDDECCDVVAGPDFADALDADHLVAGRFHRTVTAVGGRAATSQRASNRALSVAAPSASRRGRSSGLSMSTPRPGSASTAGVRPRSRAAAR